MTVYTHFFLHKAHQECTVHGARTCIVEVQNYFRYTGTNCIADYNSRLPIDLRRASKRNLPTDLERHFVARRHKANKASAPSRKKAFFKNYSAKLSIVALPCSNFSSILTDVPLFNNLKPIHWLTRLHRSCFT